MMQEYAEETHPGFSAYLQKMRSYMRNDETKLTANREISSL